MSDHDALGTRMKGYENAYCVTLPRRLPVLLRVDGRAFHTLTKNAERPFDAGLGGGARSLAARAAGR